jgi:hypothetical protein
LGDSILSRVDAFSGGLGCVTGHILHRVDAWCCGLGRVAGDLLHRGCTLSGCLSHAWSVALVEEQVNSTPGCFGQGIIRLVGCH